MAKTMKAAVSFWPIIFSHSIGGVSRAAAFTFAAVREI